MLFNIADKRVQRRRSDAFGPGIGSGTRDYCSHHLSNVTGQTRGTKKVAAGKCIANESAMREATCDGGKTAQADLLARQMTWSRQ